MAEAKPLFVMVNSSCRLLCGVTQRRWCYSPHLRGHNCYLESAKYTYCSGFVCTHTVLSHNKKDIKCFLQTPILFILIGKKQPTVTLKLTAH